jgi:hypothetical protein
MKQQPRLEYARFPLLLALLVTAASACNSTLGLSDYELTEMERCGDALVDFASDSNHCGACNQACGGGSSCVMGVCECPDAQQFCGPDCVDLSSDADHCGACDSSCASGASCVDGECECDESGATVCEDACTDKRKDAENCGECGTVCASGASCVQSACKCDVAGEIACSGACTDPKMDVDNCGECGHVCTVPNAVLSCAAGLCDTNGCDTGYLDCNYDLGQVEAGNGCEVDSRSDKENCGACGTVCDPGKTCSSSECVCDVPEAGGTCEPHTNCGCELGQGCILDMTNSWQCVTPGYVTPYAKCTTSADCTAGHACAAGVCYPYCDADDACPEPQNCLQVVDENGDDIDGYQVCVPPCSPPLYEPAPPGTTTCPYDQKCEMSDEGSFCSGTVGYGSTSSTCSSSADCAQGYTCYASTCTPYCYSGGSGCYNFGISTCDTSENLGSVGGTEVGLCLEEQGTVACNGYCTYDTDCADPSASCLDTDAGWVCSPAQCQGCFDSAQTCYYSSDSCTFSYCSP